MPNEIDRTSSAQRRSSKLLTAMAIFICLGIAAYMVLTLLVNRQTPATPDTHYTGTNGISVYYDSSVWSVCRMTEDPTLGTVLELATADTADSEDYQAVLLQRGTADSYDNFIEESEADLKQAYGVIKPALESDAITTVYGANHGIKGVLDDQLLCMDQEDRAELDRLPYTPSSALGSCRYKMKDPDEDDTDYKRILEVFKKHDVRYFFYNGGNDSMDTCNKISKYMQKVGYECRVMGVPKTIDNDLYGTDHCPGYASAAKYIATSLMEVYQDAHVYDTGMICIVEIMGRHAGWLTAAASLPNTKEPCCDFIYLPEVDFDMDKFVAEANELSVGNVYEGLLDENGKVAEG